MNTQLNEKGVEAALEVRELQRLEARLAERAAQAATLLATARGVVQDARRALEADRRRNKAESVERAERAGSAQRRRSDAEVAAAQAMLRGTIDGWSSVMATGPWVDPRWGGVEPTVLPETAVRVGSFAGRGVDSLVMVPSVGSGNVQVVAATPADRDRAVGVVNGMLLRVLASAPPGRVRFRIHDPVGLGATLSAYSQFDRQRIAHGNPTSDSRELEATLSALGAHATEVSATYLRGFHPTLRDCLRDDPHTDVAFEVLVLLDLPRGLERDLLERVSVLAGQAPARGVMVLTMQVGEVPGLDLGATGIRIDVAGAAARIPQLGATTVVLDQPPPAMLLERVAARAVAARATLTYTSLHDAPPRTESSAETVETAVGRSGREVITLRLGDDPVNGLILRGTANIAVTVRTG